jgi:hypothetical protein
MKNMNESNIELANTVWKHAKAGDAYKGGVSNNMQGGNLQHGQH